MSQEIRFIPHISVDRQRWMDCWSRSAGARVYALPEMLDAMSPGWDALVAGDYDAVMPLTWRSKLGIRYLCQPAFCAQLGVMTTGSASNLLEDFLRQTALRYRLAEICLNHTNGSPLATEVRANYVLDLSTGYDAIRAGYKNDLLKNLQRAVRFDLMYSVTDRPELALEQYKSFYGSRLGVREEDWSALRQLAGRWYAEGRAMVRSVYMPSKIMGKSPELLATGLFLNDGRRLYNIASTTLPNGRTLEANHWLFDRLIAEFAGQALLLDFEGSDLPGVARFYQKFGALNEPYFFWKSNRLPLALRWWKR